MLLIIGHGHCWNTSNLDVQCCAPYSSHGLLLLDNKLITLTLSAYGGILWP